MTNSIYDLIFTKNTGEEISLSEFKNHPILIINTASKCGLTPQYAGLQELHEKFAEKGLVVIGFPCDQFAHQEPGTDSEIAEFCSVNYGVTFTITKKVNVNGADTHPVFKFLKKQSGSFFGSSIKWNFTKFLVSADGKTIKRYAPTVVPSAIEADISKMLENN